MKFPKRKRTRLKNFDYSTAGYYFITICTHNRRPILSRIVGQGLAPAENHLSFYGTVAENQLLVLETRYPQIKIDKYIIMPNHIHAIVVITEKTVSATDDIDGANNRNATLTITLTAGNIYYLEAFRYGTPYNYSLIMQPTG